MITARSWSWLGLCTSGFATGIVAGYFQMWNVGPAMIGGLLLVPLLGLMRSIRPVIGIFVLFGVLGSLYQWSYQYQGPEHIRQRRMNHAAREVRVQGQVASDIKVTQMPYMRRYSFELEIEQLGLNGRWRLTRGRILVQLFRETEIRYGDRIETTGRLHVPFEFSTNPNFSYRDFLQRKNIHYILSVKNNTPVAVLEPARRGIKSQIYVFRKKIIQRIDPYLSTSELNLIQAILLGERSFIPRHIREIFIRTGTVHILAISGLHVGMISLLILTVLSVLNLPRKSIFVLSTILLGVYIILSGARPSVVRAGIMYIIVLGSHLFEREVRQIDTLSLAALVLLLLNPMNLFDIGFQMSFVCVAGIVVLSPKIQWLLERPLSRAKTRSGFVTGLIQSFAVSVAVALVIEMLVAYYFEIFTPVAVAANLLVVPLAMLVVYMGAGLMVFAFVWPPLAGLFAMMVKVSLNLMVGTAFLFSQLPGAYFYWRGLTLWNLIIYYFIIVMIFLVPWGIICPNLRRTKNQPKSGISTSPDQPEGRDFDNTRRL